MVNIKDLPATKENLLEFWKLVFEPAIKGESVLIYTLPKFGTNSFARFIIREAKQINAIIKRQLDSKEIIILDLKEAESSEKIDKQIREHVINPDNIQDPNTIFVLNNAEILINNDDVRSYLATFSAKQGLVKWILFFTQEVLFEDIQEKLGKFRIIKCHHLPLRKDNDITVLLDKEERWYDFKIPVESKNKIIRLAGGYSSFARVLLGVARQDYSAFLKMPTTKLIEMPEVEPWIKDIFSHLSKQTQTSLLQSIISSKDKYVISDFCYKIGIFQEQKEKPTFFSPLFEEYLKSVVQKKLHREILDNDSPTHPLIYSLISNLTKQEKSVFNALLRQKGKLLKRESIAKIIWNDWLEKYSDWAIDKLISRIRKKIFDDKREILQTIQNKGFMIGS